MCHIAYSFEGYNTHQGVASDHAAHYAIANALYMPAVVTRIHNPVIRAFCERLKAQGKNGKLITCAAMRKLLHLAFAILKSGKPFDPHYQPA